MLTVEQLPKLVLDRGYAYLADNYTTRSEVWRQFIPERKIITPSGDTMTDFPFGTRMVGSVGIGSLKEFEVGQRIEDDIIGEGYTRQAKLRQCGRKLSIPDEIVEAGGSNVSLMNEVVAWAENVRKAATRYRNDYIAGMMQKGTLSAGNTQYFDNSYRGTPDANKGKIYDGNAWFLATAHSFKNYTPSGSQGINLVTSATLSTTTLQNATVAMSVHNALDERGQKIENMPRYLVGGPTMKQLIVATAGTDRLPGSANNDLNAYNGDVIPIIWSELSDTASANAWWVFAEDPGITVFDSGLPMLRSYRDEGRRSTIFEGLIRFGAVVDDWRGAYCANKAAS